MDDLTPQEKAKQIVESFESGLTLKDCALIAVTIYMDDFDEYDELFKEKTAYWQKVKEEIRKL